MPLVFMDKKERTSHFPHFRKISLTHDNLCASTHHSLSVLSSLYNDIGEVFHVDSCIEEGEKKDDVETYCIGRSPTLYTAAEMRRRCSSARRLHYSYTEQYTMILTRTRQRTTGIIMPLFFCVSVCVCVFPIGLIKVSLYGFFISDSFFIFECRSSDIRVGDLRGRPR